jgi:metal-dependent amidase/aminoacylase/carboxypeptidase family protein
MLEGEKLGKNVFLLFQHGEESGIGGEECCALFDREQVQEIYGAHNLPGFPFGKVLTRPGTMACGSCGLTIRYTGAPAHAAYPEQGNNPAPAVGALLQALPMLTRAEDYEGMVRCTVIGCRMGEKAFGLSASSAEIWLTLRAERGADLEKLRAGVTEFAAAAARRQNLSFAAQWQDEFPATENDTAAAEKVMAVCGGELLDEYMRWSEDFGWYLKRCRGAFFGIGCGEDWPGLHTGDYEYPDALLPITAEAFYQLAAAPALAK